MLNLKRIVTAGILGIMLIVSMAAYNVFRTPAEASRPIEAIPLEESASGSSNSTTTAQSPSESATSAADVSTPDQPTAIAAEATDAPASAATDAPASAATSEQPADGVVVQIVREESEARFIIDEVLNNAPKTVVGVTNQVAGEIAIDPQNLSNIRVGIIQINARTLTTDNDFRNRAIKNQILQTDQYEYVSFTPTEIVGLPQAGAIGEAYTFQIVGDLTIRDVTQRVTFDVNATAVSDARVEGTASTTIRYADFGISIPRVRQVASVADEVRLELDFVAIPKESAN